MEQKFRDKKCHSYVGANKADFQSCSIWTESTRMAGLRDVEIEEKVFKIWGTIARTKIWTGESME